MNDAQLDTIHQIFRTFEGDGDFQLSDSNIPLAIYPGSEGSDIIFVAKPSIIGGMIGKILRQTRLTIVSKHGLLTTPEIRFIQSLSPEKRVLFLGDIDPPAIMLFAYLRNFIAGQIKFCSITPTFFSQIPEVIKDRLSMQMSANEASCVPTLRDLLPDIEDLIGADCLKRITDLKKFELEMYLTLTNLLRESLSSVFPR